MSIGLCCQFIKHKTKKNGSIEEYNSLSEKSLQFGAYNKGKYSNSYILECYLNNVSNLYSSIQEIFNLGISCFRVSSNLFPLFDLVDPDLLENDRVLSILSDIGNFVKTNKIRLTSHPDQFCVISSDDNNKINNAVKILSHHAWVFDKMKLEHSPFYAINIHGGKKDRIETLIKTIDALPDNIRKRLTLENDEMAYSVKQLYEVYRRTSTPVVCDTHHHTFNNDSLSDVDAFELALSTWKVKPLTHLSNTEPELQNGSFKDRRKHSKYVHYIPEYQLIANNKNVIDIDFEFKAKQLAIFKAVKDFGISL